MSTKILSALAIIGCLIGVAVLVTNQTSQVETLIGTGEKSDKARDRVFADSPIGKSQVTQAEGNIRSYVENTRIYITEGNSPSNLKALRTYLKTAASEVDENAKIEITGKGSSIRFCEKPNFYWVCGSVNSKSGGGTPPTKSPSKKALMEKLK